MRNYFVPPDVVVYAEQVLLTVPLVQNSASTLHCGRAS